MQEETAVILVVDDEPMTLRMLSHVLEKQGYAVICASSGSEALARVGKTAPALVLLDLYMPEMNGVTLCRRLKENPATRDIAVIAMTGHASDELMMQCLAAGANEFLAKPIDHAELALRVKNLLQIKQLETIRWQNELLEQNRMLIERRNRELAEALAQLKQSQLQIIQQEKMASVGQLAAGIMHEITSPMVFVKTNLQALQRYAGALLAFDAEIIPLINRRSVSGSLDGESLAGEIAQLRKSLRLEIIAEDTPELITESIGGMERMERIIADLKKFTRHGKTEVAAADINEGIDSILKMVECELKHKATIKKEFGVLPLALCNIGQLSQVFMNLLINAGHALDGQGEIRIRTWAENANIYVAIADTGHGMAPEVMSRVFEPFFTTKAPGQGTGLGLSIAMDIVKSHHGEIRVDSAPGQGTTFTVRIPVTAGPGAGDEQRR